MNLKYDDFDVQIEPAGDRYRVRLLNAPTGQATTEFALPFTDIEVANFLARIGQVRRSMRRVDAPELHAAKEFGGKLFNAIFSGEMIAQLRGSMEQAADKDRGLRIRLRLTDVPALGDLPWEFLYDANQNHFLTTSTETPLVRFLDLPQRIAPLRVALPLRVLVIIAGPRNLKRLDTEGEWERLQESLGDLLRAGNIVLERLPSATLDALRLRARGAPFHVLHFIGHGGFDSVAQDGVLQFEDESAMSYPVRGEMLGMLLRDHRTLRLAVLNACEGARSSRQDPFSGVAQSLLQQRVPAVIAMQFEISDAAAKEFAQEFYRAVAEGHPVDAAVCEARKALFKEEFGQEWATPALYMRSQEGQLFELQPATTAIPDEEASKRAEAEREAAKKAEAERAAKIEREQQAREKAEANLAQAAAAKAEAERAVKVERERQEREKVLREKQAQEKAESERRAREQQTHERLQREKEQAARRASDTAASANPTAFRLVIKRPQLSMRAWTLLLGIPVIALAAWFALSHRTTKTAEAPRDQHAVAAPNDAAEHAHLGNSLSQQGDLDGAIAEYRESLRMNPQDPETHYALAGVLEKKGDHEAALAQYRETLHLQPDFDKSHPMPELPAAEKKIEAIAPSPTAPASTSNKYDLDKNIPKRVFVNGGIQEARLLKKVQPVYPPLARETAVSGTVRLHLIIAREGTVQEVDALSGHPLLLQSAMNAVKQWRYKPTLRNGQAVEVETNVEVIYSLAGSSPAPAKNPTATDAKPASAASAPAASPPAAAPQPAAKDPCTLRNIQFHEQGNTLVGTLEYSYQGSLPLDSVAVGGIPFTADRKQIPGVTYDFSSLKTASGTGHFSITGRPSLGRPATDGAYVVVSIIVKETGKVVCGQTVPYQRKW